MQGLAAAWRHREAQQAMQLGASSGFRNAARRLAGPKRGDVYCTLTCEGQVGLGAVPHDLSLLCGLQQLAGSRAGVAGSSAVRGPLEWSARVVLIIVLGKTAGCTDAKH